MASSTHTHGIGPVSQQYAAAATVPLIKSPSLWMPKPVELPNDVHPLPEDITAYFVYPFNLETHVLSVQPQPHEAISHRRARNAQILHQRDVEEEQKEKEELRKKAPGYNPGLLVPMSKSTPKPTPAPEPKVEKEKEKEKEVEVEGLESMITPFETNAPVNEMDQLVEQLEQMDGRK